MDYIEYRFSVEPASTTNSEILMAWLSDLPFESFKQTDNGLLAYIQESECEPTEIKRTVEQIVIPDTSIRFETKLIPRENWNSEWEKNFFSPIFIDDQCVIKSSFHTDVKRAEYEILIDPKMSFGTGHHATTTLMVKQLLKRDFKGCSLLDMGCGTGVLAILAVMRGAAPVTAIDIDDWAYENTKENIVTNETPEVEVGLGGAELLHGRKFDVILANINRNILVSDMESYTNCLPTGGFLIMSGFYQYDIDVIEKHAKSLGMTLDNTEVLNDWACCSFLKNE